MICTCGRTRPHCAARQRCMAGIVILLFATAWACRRVRAGLTLVRPAVAAGAEARR
jgi:hypothetical protein